MLNKQKVVLCDEESIYNNQETSMVIQGFGGWLNLWICLDDVSSKEMSLLIKCKSCIEKDPFAPCYSFDTDTTRSYFECADLCIKKLLSINPKKAEYHYLYAVTVHNIYDNNDKNIELAAKHLEIAYILDPNHPTIYMQCNKGDIPWKCPNKAKLNKLWYYEMEINLFDLNYRNKYKSIINELECKFIHKYTEFLLDKSGEYHGGEYNRNSESLYSLTAYFERYCDIILNKLILDAKQDNKYIFIYQHFEYLTTFALNFRVFGEYKKSLKAMNIFTDLFDNDYQCLLYEYHFDEKLYLIQIDVMLALGLYKDCIIFIKKLINSRIPITNTQYINAAKDLFLTAIKCRIFADDILYGNVSSVLPKHKRNTINIYESNINKLIKVMKKQKYGTGRLNCDFAIICLLYFKVFYSPNIEKETIQKYKIKIQNIFIETMCKFREFYCSESSFMLANIYQNIYRNSICAAFLYFICILTSNALNPGMIPPASISFGYTHIMSYYNLSICLIECKQYQIALNLLKRIIKFTSEMSMIKQCKTSIYTLTQTLKHKKCGYCNRSNVKLKSCRGCGYKFYCNKNCQKMDWKLNKHRIKCSAFWSDKQFLLDRKSITQCIGIYFHHYHKYRENVSKHIVSFMKAYS